MLDLNEAQARDVARSIYGEARPCRIDLVRAGSHVADGCAIYFVDAAYVLHVSPDGFPNAMKDEVETMRTVRAALGPCAHMLPSVTAEGVLDGRSFRVLPLMRPLSSGRLLAWIDRLRVRRPLLDWLRVVAARVESPSDDAAARFSQCLTSLTDMTGLPDALTAAAGKARADLDRGRITPGHVPMHGDLWTGNVLRRQDGSLCIIDWGGALPRGYGMFDLVRLCISLGVPARVARRELAAHAVLLGGPLAAKAHLLAAPGHIAGHLGQFPQERFIEMAVDVHARFEASR